MSVAETPADERILQTAYDLFARRGIRDVGVDEIVERAGVARATFYRHYRSKDELALAFLSRREQRWTFGAVEAEASRRGKTAEEQLLAIFDVFDEWFRRPDFEGCSFINIMLEHPDPADPVHRACTSYLAGIRHFLEDLARRAGITEAEDFAREWHIMMKGSIVAAAEGDSDAARRAQKIARLVLEQATRDGR
jgi:AcrR family transcriptional regulator